ncbi:MAG: GAF domain-containing protein [Desulfohalobiaceae bacterium]
MSDNYFLDRILGLICSVFEAYSAVLFLAEGDRGYRLATSFSLGDNIRENLWLESGQGLVGWIIRNNQPLLINDFDRSGDCLGYYSPEAESKIKAFMGCPLNNAQGVLCLDSKKSYSFSAKDQKILHQFVQLVQALQDAFWEQGISRKERSYYICLQMLRGLRLKHPKWSFFLQDLLQCIAEHTGFSHCFLAARDERGHNFFLEGWNQPIFSTQEEHHKSFHMDEGLIGWVFRNHCFVSTAEQDNKANRAPLFEKKSKAKQFPSVICVPLVVHMRTRGVLVLASEQYQDSGQELKEFMLLAGDYLALFLENLYLKNRLRQQQTSEDKQS